VGGLSYALDSRGAYPPIDTRKKGVGGKMGDDRNTVNCLGQRLTRYSPLPVGNRLYYECQLCGDKVHSVPNQPTYCSCGNIGIDSVIGRPKIRNLNRALLVCYAKGSQANFD
jgi:hypothetical protein